MMRWFLFILTVSVAWGCTPRTGYSFCATLTQVHTQNGSTDSASFPVGVIGTANGTGLGAFASSNVDLSTTGNGGKIQQTVPIGGLLSGVYKSGGTLSGTGVCNLASFNGGSSGATATVPVTGGAITANTSIVITAPGTSTTTDPTSATFGSCTGGATASGTATVDVLFATFVTPADLAFTADSSGTTLLPFEFAVREGAPGGAAPPPGRQ
jgi:hypothetical protein